MTQESRTGRAHYGWVKQPGLSLKKAEEVLVRKIHEKQEEVAILGLELQAVRNKIASEKRPKHWTQKTKEASTTPVGVPPKKAAKKRKRKAKAK